MKRFYLFKSMTFLLVAVCLWLVINVSAIRELLITYDQLNLEKGKISTLDQELRDLQNKQQQLHKNGFEIERLARERLSLQMPGEQVIYLRAQDRGTSVTRVPATSIAAPATTVTSTRPPAEVAARETTATAKKEKSRNVKKTRRGQ